MAARLAGPGRLAALAMALMATAGAAAGGGQAQRDSESLAQGMAPGAWQGAPLAETDASRSWTAVQGILEAYFPLPDLAFSAGDAAGRKFTLEKGNMTMSAPLVMASSSKFPAASAIVGVVADGHMSLDTRSHELFPWWTSDPEDRRSRVTLRHLLSFTSGFFSPDAGGSLPCLAQGGEEYSSEACAREIYERAPHEFEPGSTWAYNSFHLQVAGAMAAKASNLTVQEVLRRYLIDKLDLRGTFWMGGENPALAGNMITTGDDYDEILRAYLGYRLVPKRLADEMEQDYVTGGVRVANSSTFLARLLGHYSLGTYFECLPPKPADFTARCLRANVHMDAGLFGYYPLVDRNHGTYMQVVAMKLAPSFAPTIASLSLRLLIKHSVDRALRRGGANGLPGVAAAEGPWTANLTAREAARAATAMVLEQAGLDEAYGGPEGVWALLGRAAGPGELQALLRSAGAHVGGGHFEVDA